MHSTEQYKRIKKEVAELRSRVEKYNSKCDLLVQFQQEDTAQSEEGALLNDYNIKVTELALRRLKSEVETQVEVVDSSFENFNNTLQQSIVEISQIECVKAQRAQKAIEGVVNEFQKLLQDMVPKTDE